MASERYRRNNIVALHTEDGICVEDHAGKEAILFQSFKQRLGNSSHKDMKFDLPTILPRATNLEQLTTPFTHEEIDKVVQEMPSD